MTVDGTEYTIWASAYMEVRGKNDGNTGCWYPNYNLRFSPAIASGLIEKVSFDGNLYQHGSIESVHNKRQDWPNPSGNNLHTWSEFNNLNISGALDYVGEYKIKFNGIDEEVTVSYSTVGQSDEFRMKHLTKSLFSVEASARTVSNSEAAIDYEVSAILPDAHTFTNVKIYEGYDVAGEPVYSSSEA